MPFIFTVNCCFLWATAPLPDILQSLNGITMKALIRGLMKDLKLSWSSDKPEWWPDTVPFLNVTQPAPDYEG